MFNVGDFIVYGSNGVCRVEEIGKLSLGQLDENKLYYTLKPVYQKGSMVYTPIENNKAVMRKIMSSDEVWQLIQEIPEISVLEVKDEKEWQETCRESIRNYDCRGLVRIIKTIYLRNQERLREGKKMSSTEERMLSAAEDFLHGEMAMILNIPKNEVEAYISSKIEEIKRIDTAV